MKDNCELSSESKPHVEGTEVNIEIKNVNEKINSSNVINVKDTSLENPVNSEKNDGSSKTSLNDDDDVKYIARIDIEIDADGNYIDNRTNIAPEFKIEADTVLLSKRQMKKAKRMVKCDDGKKIPAMQAATGITETNSYIENDLRKVYPYKFVFGTYVKRRWIGRTIEDVVMDEFSYGMKEKSDMIFKYSKVKINKEPTNRNYIIKDGDYLESTIHRHEMSVTSSPLKIVYEDDHTLVILKPCSIPVHPCGRFRHNSLTFMLARPPFNYQSLRTLYRLDRLTSGMVIFAKHEPATKKYMLDITQRTISKTYLARVVGEFPQGYIECKEPLGELCPKIGLWRVIPDSSSAIKTPPVSTEEIKKRKPIVAPSTAISGKQSRTGFQRISFNGTSSVVLCRPYTGRTHQIRVHLQYMGFPIIDDPLYRGEVWGDCGGKDGNFGKTDKQLIEDLLEIHARHNFTDSGYLSTNENAADDSPLVTPTSYSIHREWLKKLNTKDSAISDIDEKKNDETEEDLPSKKLKLDDDAFDADKMIFDDTCLDCLQPYRDPGTSDLHMCLHALSYEGPDWKFNTSPPKWAKSDYEIDV